MVRTHTVYCAGLRRPENSKLSTKQHVSICRHASCHSFKFNTLMVLSLCLRQGKFILYKDVYQKHIDLFYLIPRFIAQISTLTFSEFN